MWWFKVQIYICMLFNSFQHNYKLEIYGTLNSYKIAKQLFKITIVV
jgi:hypothetical protein